MRREASIVHGGHGILTQTGRMDPGTSSDQATAAPGGPGRIVREERAEELHADREPERPDETVGLGFTNLTSPGSNACIPSHQPASGLTAVGQPDRDCGLHSVPLNYAAAVKGDSERDDHGRVLVLTAYNGVERKTG